MTEQSGSKLKQYMKKTVKTKRKKTAQAIVFPTRRENIFVLEMDRGGSRTAINVQTKSGSHLMGYLPAPVAKVKRQQALIPILGMD